METWGIEVKMRSKDLPISVSLIIRGDSLEPSCVTNKLRITPSRSQRKGEKKTTSTNKQYVTKIGLWKLSSDSDSRFVSDHISNLLSRIGAAEVGVLIKEFEDIQEAYIDVFIAEVMDESGEGTCEFDISQEDINRLARVGLPVRFTVAHVKK